MVAEANGGTTVLEGAATAALAATLTTGTVELVSVHESLLELLELWQVDLSLSLRKPEALSVGMARVFKFGPALY